MSEAAAVPLRRPLLRSQAIPVQAKFTLLSRRYCGDIVAVISEKRHRTARIGNFTLRGVYLPGVIRMSTLWRDAAYGAITLVRVTYAHYFRHTSDAIVAPEPLVAGVLALLIGRSDWRARGDGSQRPVRVRLQIRGAKPSLKDRLKEKYHRSHRSCRAVQGRCCETALPWAGGRTYRRSAVAEFALLRQLRLDQPVQGRPRRLEIHSFLGYPWYLKGVDILIRAFQRVSPEFPGLLTENRWLVHQTRRLFETARRHGNLRIELCNAVALPGSYPVNGGMLDFRAAIADRRDRTGSCREAMASRKPIIASNVGRHSRDHSSTA